MLASWLVIVGCPCTKYYTKRFLVMFLLFNVTDRGQRHTARFTSLPVQFWPFLTSFISSPPIVVFSFENNFAYIFQFWGTLVRYYFILWLQDDARSDWSFSCNDMALLARCPRHIQSVFNFDSRHPYGHTYYVALFIVIIIYIYFNISIYISGTKFSLQLTGYAHAPRHTILTVYSIQKFSLHNKRTCLPRMTASVQKNWCPLMPVLLIKIQLKKLKGKKRLTKTLYKS